jgi:hypothetical protein
LYTYEFHNGDEQEFMKLYHELRLWKIKRVSNINQKDGRSCGLIAFIFAILLSFKVDVTKISNIDITNDMMITMRTKMAASILCKKLFFSKYYVDNINDKLQHGIHALLDNNIKLKVSTIEDALTTKGRYYKYYKILLKCYKLITLINNRSLEYCAKKVVQTNS